MARTQKGAAGRSADSPFSRVVKERLGEKNLTLKALAREMGVPEDRVRQWIYRRKFPESNLLQLCARLGLPTDPAELHSKYGVQTTTHGRANPSVFDVAQTIESVVAPRIPDPPKDGFGADIIQFLRSMENGETFLVWSVNEHSFEWTNVGWRAVGNALAWAISEKGIYCGYLHPSEDELNRLRDVCGIRNLPHEDFFEKAFEQFTKNLETMDEIRDVNTGMILMDGQREKRLSRENIRKHVVRVPVKAAAFCVPDLRFVLFVPPNPFGGKAPSALATFPVSGKKSNLLLPLDETTTFDLYDYLVTSPKQLEKVSGDKINSPIMRLVVKDNWSTPSSNTYVKER